MTAVPRPCLAGAALLLGLLAPARALAGGDPCLTAVSVTPMADAGEGAIFEAVYGHCEGAETFRIVQIWFGNEVAIDVPHASGGFEGGLFFFGDAPAGSCAPGEAVELATAVATLDCAMSSATLTGTQMIVQWAVRFDTAAFGGPRGIWFDAKGGDGDPEPRLGWTQVGSYDVQDVATSTGSVDDESGGATAGSVGAATGTGASTQGDDGSGTATTSDDPTGTLPGLASDRRDPSGCACTSDARTSPSGWLLALIALALGGGRARRGGGSVTGL